MANLITLEEYKEYMGLESLKDETRLTSLILSASQLVKTYCANSFVDYYTTAKVELFNVDWATHLIQLSETPLVSVTSVEERTSYSGAYTALSTTSQEYYVDIANDTILRTTGSGYADWPLGPGAVRVTYKAGYASVPEDLKRAVVDIVTYYHKEEYKERKSLGSASIQNRTTTSQTRNVSFPDHIKRVLDLYKQYNI